MDKTIITNILNEISNSIIHSGINHDNIGVLEGKTGLCLFQYFYAKEYSCNSAKENADELITSIIDEINSGYFIPTYSSGIAGFAWGLGFLYDNAMINMDIDDFLEDLDDIFFNIMIKDLTIGNLDFLHGGLGYGYYFVQRYHSTKSSKMKKKYKSFIGKCLFWIDYHSIKLAGDMYAWKSYLPKNQPDVINLSASHGLSGTINFLRIIHPIDEFSKTVTDLMFGALNFIKSKINIKEKSCYFSDFVQLDGVEETKSRVAWCYGDLGIAYIINMSARTLRDENLEKFSLEILRATTKRKEKQTTMVSDGSVCHGAFGNSLIYLLLNDSYNQKIFSEASNYWLNQGLDMSIYKNGNAGFKSWLSKTDSMENSLSLLEGVSGIGLTLLTHLSITNKKWAESLILL